MSVMTTSRDLAGIPLLVAAFPAANSTARRTSHIALRYELGRPPVLAVRIQELFALMETPRIAGGRVPVLLHLLGPNYRPQQVTDDLRSFWTNTYPQVRKDLRAHYPKHAWPEDPLSAEPESRPRRKRPGG
jgi:ATP-dependent helicase HrpB